MGDLPRDGQLEPAPDWLLTAIRRRKRSATATVVNGVESVLVPAGNRHQALVSLLGHMRRWGACREVLDAAAVAFVEHQCLDNDPERPIDMQHVHDTAKDIAGRY